MTVRRALSEIVGSLIVLAMISVAALTYASLYMKAAKGLEKAASSAVEAVDDKFMAPVMMPDVYNGDLVLHVMPVKPVKIKYIIIVSNSSISVINVSKVIDTVDSFTLVRNYTCEPLFISLVTDSGVILRYSPLRDPRVDLNKLSPEEIVALEPGYVDCRVLDILKSAGSNYPANQTAINGTVIYNGQERYISMTADPPTYSIATDPNDVYTVDYFNVIINGKLSAGQASLTFQVLDSSGLLLGEAKIDASGPSSQASYLFAVPTSLGETVPVYAKVSCSISSCVAGLFFESNGSFIITGEASVTATIRYDLPVNQCPYSKLSFTLPMILAPKANFTSSTSGTCSVQWGIHVSIEGWANGNFETWGPLILAASTTTNTNISLSVNLWIRETVKVATIQPARLQLPIHGPIAYSRIPINVTASDPLTDAVLTFIKSDVDQIDLFVSAEELTARRPVTTSQQIIPLSNANYTLEAWLKAYTHFTAKLVVSYYTSQQTATLTSYEWNVTVKEAPLPDPRSLPIIVKVESLENNTKYLILLPRAVFSITQGGSTYKGLAPLMGDAPASISPAGNLFTFYIFKANGSIASSLEVQASIFYNPTVDIVLEVDPLTGGFTTPGQQAVYLIIPVIRDDSYNNQNKPPAAWIIVY